MHTIVVEVRPDGLHVQDEWDTHNTQYPEFLFYTDIPSHDDVLRAQGYSQPPDGIPGIYVLIHDNKVVYVGQSTRSVMRRIEAHEIDKEFDDMAMFAVPRHLVDLVEAALIGRYEPKYNRARPRMPRVIEP